MSSDVSIDITDVVFGTYNGIVERVKVTLWKMMRLVN